MFTSSRHWFIPTHKHGYLWRCLASDEVVKCQLPSSGLPRTLVSKWDLRYGIQTVGDSLTTEHLLVAVKFSSGFLGGHILPLTLIWRFDHFTCLMLGGEGYMYWNILHAKHWISRCPYHLCLQTNKSRFKDLHLVSKSKNSNLVFFTPETYFLLCWVMSIKSYSINTTFMSSRISMFIWVNSTKVNNGKDISFHNLSQSNSSEICSSRFRDTNVESKKS